MTPFPTSCIYPSYLSLSHRSTPFSTSCISSFYSSASHPSTSFPTFINSVLDSYLFVFSTPIHLYCLPSTFILSLIFLSSSRAILFIRLVRLLYLFFYFLFSFSFFIFYICISFSLLLSSFFSVFFLNFILPRFSFTSSPSFLSFPLFLLQMIRLITENQSASYNLNLAACLYKNWWMQLLNKRVSGCLYTYKKGI